jgi:ribosomal protein S18 acetylase RimI-like enzyme
MISVTRATELSQCEAAESLFDGVIAPDASQRFLASPGHHLLLAHYDDATEPVGFITGVEMTHPDKGTEMFIYELGVDEAHRRRGIASALVFGLAELAKEGGCYGMWVGVDSDNHAALATYRKA